MKFEDKIRVAEEFVRPIEAIIEEIKHHELFMVSAPVQLRYWVRVDDSSWDFTGWLLERLPEWKELSKFAEYHKLLGEIHYKDSNVPLLVGPKDKGEDGPVTRLIPLGWLTSPSILPEKIGEYIKWRDEHANR